jgi:transcriptional regulator with XRE-family HTH domain
MKESARELFARRIKTLRMERCWPQEELAAINHLDRSYVGAPARCEKSATLDTVEKIACAFGIPVVELFGAEIARLFDVDVPFLG